MKLRHLIALLIILVPPALYYVYYHWAGKALSPETLTALGAIVVIAAGWVAFTDRLISLWTKLTSKAYFLCARPTSPSPSSVNQTRC